MALVMRVIAAILGGAVMIAIAALRLETAAIVAPIARLGRTAVSARLVAQPLRIVGGENPIEGSDDAVLILRRCRLRSQA